VVRLEGYVDGERSGAAAPRDSRTRASDHRRRVLIRSGRASPEERPRARELFARKVLGTASATDSTGVLLSSDGTRLALEISSVPLLSGERVVGVFGLLAGPLEDEARPPHPHLTPRQAEVLRLLEQGYSTKQIAHELHLSSEAVRNHIRHLFRALGVHSRLEAIAAARRGLEPGRKQTNRNP
jgi:DNA-binding NarL/FixJ family response regulator